MANRYLRLTGTVSPTRPLPSNILQKTLIPDPLDRPRPACRHRLHGGASPFPGIVGTTTVCKATPPFSQLET